MFFALGLSMVQSRSFAEKSRPNPGNAPRPLCHATIGGSMATFFDSMIVLGLNAYHGDSTAADIRLSLFLH